MHLSTKDNEHSDEEEEPSIDERSMDAMRMNQYELDYGETYFQKEIESTRQ